MLNTQERVNRSYEEFRKKYIEYIEKLPLSEQQILGRLTGGIVGGISLGIADNNIVQVDHTEAADNDYAKFTSSGIEGRSYAEVWSDLSGQMGASVDLNQQITLSGSGVTYFKERPRLELSRTLGTSKPSIVTLGMTRGFSLPVYNSDNEELFFDLPCVPARWDGASDPVVIVQGYLDTANTNKKFKLACDWVYFTPDDDAIAMTAVESPSAQTSVTVWSQYHSFAANITLNYDVVAANPLAVSDFLQLRLYRVAATLNEIAGEVVVTGVAIKWKMNKLYSST